MSQNVFICSISCIISIERDASEPAIQKISCYSRIFLLQNSSVPVPYKLLVKCKGFDELKNDKKHREVWLFKDSPEYKEAVEQRQQYMKSNKGPYKNP